jgi:glycosidase
LLGRVDPNSQFSMSGGLSLGARLAEVCQGNKDDIIWATNLLLSQPGTPIIYYGNEIGMRNLDLPQRPADTRTYVRGQFDWSEAEKQKSDPSSILNSVRGLIHSRNKL